MGLAAFVVSRACVFVGASVRAVQLRVDGAAEGIDTGSAYRGISEVLTSWDGLWYLKIARLGYPRSIPPHITFLQDEARVAFFPLYPAAIRWVDVVLPGGDTVAALAVNLALSLVAVVLVGLLARRLFGIDVAVMAMVLFSLFPGSYVLSFAYAEALLVVLSAACLLFLLDRRWVLAGVAGALATATRPNALAVVLACAVAAWDELCSSRDWRALAAPLLAPVGYVGFQVWLAAHTGERTPWWRVQREAWGEGWSFGWAALERVADFFVHPMTSPTSALTVATLGSLAVGVWAMWRRPLPRPQVAYVTGIVVLMLLPSTVTARPRFLFAAFPMFISIAAWLPRRRNVGTDLLMAASGAGLVGVTMLYAVFGAVP